MKVKSNCDGSSDSLAYDTYKNTYKGWVKIYEKPGPGPSTTGDKEFFRKNRGRRLFRKKGAKTLLTAKFENPIKKNIFEDQKVIYVNY